MIKGCSVTHFQSMKTKKYSHPLSKFHFHLLEFKVRINGVVATTQKVSEDGWTMQDGTSWPGNNVRYHPGMIQVFLGQNGVRDIEGNELPRLIYVSREKRPGFEHHKKAGSMNSLFKHLSLPTLRLLVVLLRPKCLLLHLLHMMCQDIYGHHRFCCRKCLGNSWSCSCKRFQRCCIV